MGGHTGRDGASQPVEERAKGQAGGVGGSCRRKIGFGSSGLSVRDDPAGGPAGPIVLSRICRFVLWDVKYEYITEDGIQVIDNIHHQQSFWFTYLTIYICAWR